MEDTNAATAVDEFEDNALETDASSDFEGGALAGNNEFDAYEKGGKLGDVDDQVERRIIEEGTRVTLGVMGFVLITKKGNPNIMAKFEVTAPAEFVGEETNFRTRLWLDAARAEGMDYSGWDQTKRTVGRIAAAVLQKKVSDPAVNDFLDPAFLAVAGVKDPVEKKRKFYVALTSLLNEELKGKTFPTNIGVRAAEGKFKAQQQLGGPIYPGSRPYEKREK